MSVSSNVEIMTTAELLEYGDRMFQKGVERGRFEQRVDESQAKATEGKAGMAVGTPHVRLTTAGTGLRVGEASADLPTTSEFMDVTAGETAPNSPTQDQAGTGGGVEAASFLEYVHNEIQEYLCPSEDREEYPVDLRDVASQCLERAFDVREALRPSASSPPAGTAGIRHDAIETLRADAFKLTPAEQYRLAFFIAENVGYVLEREPDHPDSPHPPASTISPVGGTHPLDLQMWVDMQAGQIAQLLAALEPFQNRDDGDEEQILAISPKHIRVARETYSDIIGSAFPTPPAVSQVLDPTDEVYYEGYEEGRRDRSPAATDSAGVAPFADGGYGQRLTAEGEAYISEYEYDDYTPTDFERGMISDAFNGIMSHEPFFGIIRAMAAHPARGPDREAIARRIDSLIDRNNRLFELDANTDDARALNDRAIEELRALLNAEAK